MPVNAIWQIVGNSMGLLGGQITSVGLIRRGRGAGFRSIGCRTLSPCGRLPTAFGDT
ncbi:MAG: hypothetical protein K0Q46_3975 [Rhodococcus erythropolis]|nr:hypothetical protein [Rhodococcus erythropolis]